MKTEHSQNRELMLEVVKDGYHRWIFRTITGNGTVLYLEESELVDYSRPISADDDFNVFFTLRAFWKAFTEYASIEGVLKRQVWHQSLNEWVLLRPVYIHEDIRPLIGQSLKDAIAELHPGNTQQVEGIRTWLRALATSTADLDNAIRTLNSLRNAV